MTHAPLLAALLALSAAAPQDPAADAARLVPPGSFLTVRVESAERLHALGSRLAAMAGDDVPADAAAMLADMDLPGDSSQIDVTRPGFVALALEGMATTTTFVVPVRDAAAFVASLDDPTMHTATLGGYVGVSQQAGYAASAEPNALVATMRPGLASVHLDLKSVIQTYRPMIEMGMSQAEVMIDQALLETEEDAPMDMAALMELYIEAVWAFVDSADQLDVAMTYDGRSAQVRSWLSTLPDSPMASLGGEESFDLRTAAGWLDPEAAFSMIMACDMAKSMERFAPLMDLIFDAYPPEFSAEMRRFMDAYEPIWPLMGNHVASSGDIGEGGLRASYTMLCADPAALSAEMTTQLASLAGEGSSPSFSVSAPQEVELGGGRAVRAKLNVDFRAMTEGMLEGEDIDAEEFEKMESLMDSIYGKDGLQMVWRPLKDRLAMSIGGDDAFAAATLAAQPRDYAGFPAELRDAIEAASGGSMGLVYRIDYGRLFSDMAPLFEDMGVEEFDVFADKDLRLPVTFWMGIAKTTWSSGVGMDLGQLAAVVAKMQAAEASEADDGDSDD